LQKLAPHDSVDTSKPCGLVLLSLSQ